MSLYFAFNICALTNINSLWISIKTQLQNMHHDLTAVSTADIVTCIEYLAFWFYKYHQNSRSRVASSITPICDNRDCVPFVMYLLKTTIKRTAEWDYYTRFVYKTSFPKRQSRLTLTMRSWEIIYVEYI